ncbi:MAG: hypothetical protein IIW50_00970 [Alistipes sp.]|nr:hypothetical protein [Alistipes sp.]
MEVVANKPISHQMRARIVETPTPKATAEEGEKVFPHAVKMILYIACLHSFLINLQNEMEDIGQYRHAKKRWLNQAIDNIGNIHQTLHKNLGNYSKMFALWYNAQLDKAEQTINECILVEPPHRAYSIVMALFRMVEKSNNMCGRWKSPIIRAYLPEAKKLIDRCEFPVEDKHIDFILESQIDTKTLTHEIDETL